MQGFRAKNGCFFVFFRCFYPFFSFFWVRKSPFLPPRGSKCPFPFGHVVKKEKSPLVRAGSFAFRYATVHLQRTGDTMALGARSSGRRNGSTAPAVRTNRRCSVAASPCSKKSAAFSLTCDSADLSRRSCTARVGSADYSNNFSRWLYRSNQMSPAVFSISPE